MPDVMGYYSAPAAQPVAAQPAQPSTTVNVSSVPSAPGQQPIATSDAWVPSSFSDPYVAGMRTSGAALAVARSLPKIDTNIRWNAYVAARKVTNPKTVMTATMKKAKTFESKRAILEKVAKGPKAKSVGVGSAIRHTVFSFSNIGRAVLSSAIIAVPTALITNFLDFRAGKINAEQRNTLFVADSLGYTATGAASTLIGGAVAATFMGPFLGGMVGIAAGFGLGWVYEKFIRPTWGNMVHSALYATPAPAPVAVTPAPTPPAPVAPPTPVTVPATPPVDPALLVK